MQIILLIPFDVSLILFIFYAFACFVLPIAVASLILPYVGFAAMLLLTIQIYIWYFTEKA